ncbi:hypothetical protein [Nonomuraea sediminis]|uniref:hypothetical protein n=1 Tax=Nonomuraea sediminis TaxID=2835864 RepID=UPI001BDC1A87|nr:hypothetical protein [Nonomuraea sediminis]
MKITPLLMGISAAALLGAFAVSPASAEQTKTKTVSFRGMSIVVPAGWKVRRSDTDAVGKDWLQIWTTSCHSKPSCPSFDIVGPKVIRGGDAMESYKTDHPFAPGTGVSGCRFRSDTKFGERYPSTKPAVNGHRDLGSGHKAQYREWAAECYDFNTNKAGKRFTQREWYLPKAGILVADGWNTPGLAKILEQATWS